MFSRRPYFLYFSAKEAAMKLSGAQIVIEALLEQQVDTVFGYPGGTILNVYDALYDYSDRITHIRTAHEQAAAHAADGYARSTGRVGVCLATSGPGATNLITGIASAYMDSSPVVFITCNVTDNLIGKDAFQEVDITGISMPITKCNYLVRDVNELADVLREAFAIARSSRPGPVLVDIAKNVTYAEAEYEFLPLQDHPSHGRLAAMERRAAHDLNAPRIIMDDIDRLIEMLRDSERPLILVGGGVIRSKGAVPEFRRFVETLGVPTATTVMGGGALPGNHPLITGMIGMHGSRASNFATAECDLLVAIGCRFSDRVATDPASFASQAKIVHIDIDRAEVDKNIVTDHHIIGDACAVLKLLNQRLPKKDFTVWREHVLSRREPPLLHGEKLQPFEILETIQEIDTDAIITTDVGQHQMWSAQYFHFSRPGQLITSGGFGAMGFGMGASMGAKLGNPDKTVVLCTGDGGFRMSCNELSTVACYGIPIVIVIFNNHTLGMVRQWQTLLCDCRYSQTDENCGPDFQKLAGAYGLPSTRVDTRQEFEAAFRTAKASGGPWVIECDISKDETVHPMVNAGSPVTKLLLS